MSSIIYFSIGFILGYATIELLKAKLRRDNIKQLNELLAEGKITINYYDEKLREYCSKN